MIRLLVVLGALANIAGSSVYVADTYHGRSKPNRMTFVLWTIAPLIATVASLSAGVTWAVIPVFVSALCPLFILGASFFNKDAYWELGALDYVCGAFSLIALVLWALTRDPALAVVFSIASDGLAGVPTLFKAWRYPETETLWGYLGGAFSGVTGVLVASQWNIVSIGFPVYLFAICVVIAAGIIRGRLRVRR